MQKVFSLTRVYSLGNVLLITILTIGLNFGNISINSKFIETCLMGLLFWISCVFLLEFFHKSVDGREKFLDRYMLLIPVILLVSILLTTAPMAIIFFILALISVKIYSLKSKNLPISHIVFIFRPVTELGIMFAAAAIYNYNLHNPELWILSLLVFLISISRNLIGDIRDVQFDRYTLPRKIGTNKTYLLSFLILLILIILCIFNALFYALIPLFLMSILIIIKLDPYVLHRIYIICSSFFFAFLLPISEQSINLVIILLFISVISNFTYNITPRKSNPTGIEWI